MNHSDPTAELRERILSLTQCCPKGLIVDDCPFRMLNEHCRGTKTDTLKQMDYAALLKLFDFSTTCVCPADPRRETKEHPATGLPVVPKEQDIPQA